MKCKNGFWSGGGLPPLCETESEKFMLFLWYLGIAKEANKKSQNPTKHNTQPPKHTFPHSFPFLSLHKPEVGRDLQTSASLALPPDWSGARDLVPLLWSHFSFPCTRPGDSGGFLWVTVTGIVTAEWFAPWENSLIYGSTVLNFHGGTKTNYTSKFHQMWGPFLKSRGCINYWCFWIVHRPKRAHMLLEIPKHLSLLKIMPHCLDLSPWYLWA